MLRPALISNVAAVWRPWSGTTPSSPVPRAIRRQVRRKLCGSSGVPTSVVNTRPLSFQSGPAVNRSCAWRVRCSRSRRIRLSGSVTVRTPVRERVTIPRRSWPFSSLSERFTDNRPATRSMSVHWSPVSSPGRRPSMSAQATSASRRSSVLASRNRRASSGVSAFRSFGALHFGTSATDATFLVTRPRFSAC